MNWNAIIGIGYWWFIDLSIIAISVYATRVYVWKPLLNYLDLNKESIR
jgi:hypothetical protein